MSDGRTQFDEELESLQALLATLESLPDPAARSAAREIVQVVISLHEAGLRDLLGIVDEAGCQPADTLLAKFAANPRVCGLLLLHDLHPENLETRARKAVERLRPHLGVQGIRAAFDGAADGVIRISVQAVGQAKSRPSAKTLREEITEAVLAMTPDAADLIIDGLEQTGGANEAYVAVSSIAGRREPGERAGAGPR